MPILKHISIYAGAALLCAGGAFAQNPATRYQQTVTAPARDTLHPVQVHAKRIPVTTGTVTPAQVLGGKKLERLNSLSVADAVRFFSGVQLKDYGGVGGLKTINIRSMGTNHLAVFYDGMMLGNAQNGQVDLGKLSLDNIGEIALYNGQQSNIFLTARGFSAGSVLLLQSKKPHFENGATMHGRATVKTGSSGLVNPSLNWQQKIFQRIYATVSTEWTNANGRYPFRYTNGVYDTTAIRQNGNVNSWRTEAGLNGTLADSSSWSLKYYLFHSSRGLPGAIVANHFHYGQHLWDRDMFLKASYSKPFSKSYRLMLNANYTNLRTRYKDPEYPNEQHLLDNVYKQQEFYASVVNGWQLAPWWEATLAGDFIVNRMSANLYRFTYPTRYTELVALATRIHAGRWEMQGNVLATFVDESVKAYAGAGPKREYTPFISLAWQPLRRQNLLLRAFYKNIFRMPTFNDLYYTFVGNNNLQPEYVKQFDAGFSYTKAFRGSWQFLAVQADAYYNRVKDKIVAVPSDNLFGWSMQNLGLVSIKGIDAVINAAWQHGGLTLEAGLNYTYQQAQDVTSGKGGFNYGQQIPYTPWHSGSLTAGAGYRGLSLNYSFIYTGERYSQKRNIPVNYIAPWYTSDINLGWESKQGKRFYRLSAEVNNLLNQQYDVILNFPMPGRTWRVTLCTGF